MGESSLNQPTASRGDRPAARPMATDTMVYLTLIVLTWLVWQISRQGYFEAGDDVG
jgi:hypothetical protein